MKTYVFKVVLERDHDFDGNPWGWQVYCPDLVKQGAATWGETREEALKNIQDVLEMTLESMIEYGDEIPAEPVESEEKAVLKSEVMITV